VPSFPPTPLPDELTRETSKDNEPKASTKLTEKRAEKAYGQGLLPGEGQAIAAYAASGARIPRRGEIGLPAPAISRLEASGYVMSGSRHAAMNAVRERKEAQVLTVEGRRRTTLEALEEKKRREEEIIKGLRSLVNERLRKATDQSNSANDEQHQ
jgi:hypothetical protein